MRFCKTVVTAGLAAALTFGIGAAPALAVSQSDVDAAAARLSDLGSQLSSIQSELQTATDDVVKTSQELSAKQGEVEQTQNDLTSKRGELSDIMRSYYKRGSTSTLDFILGSTSVDDLVSRVVYLDKVSEQRAEVISSVKSMETQLKQEESELEERQAQQNQKVEDLQSQASEYDSRVSEATSYYNSLDSELQAQVASVAAQQNSAVAAAVQTAKQTNEQQAQASAAKDSQVNQEDQAKQDQAAETVPTTPSETKPSQPKPNNSNSNSGSSSKPSNGGGGSYGGGGVSTALAQIGKPYVSGATGPDSFDCSGLVCYSYGYKRGRTTYDMIASLQSTGDWKTDMSQLNYGDLVFTSEGHVGIYLGGGIMVDAPKPGYSVRTTSLWSFIGGGPY
jgi:peptidoglycan hydrolase CwlO-like protein